MKFTLALLLITIPCVIRAGEIQVSTTMNMSAHPILNISSATFGDGSLLQSNTFFIVLSTPISATTSTTFQNKLQSTVTLSGIYLIEWSAEINNDTNGKAAELRFLDKISGEIFGQSAYAVGNGIFWSTISGFIIHNSTQTFNYGIQWRQQLGGTGNIRNARIFYKRLL